MSYIGDIRLGDTIDTKFVTTAAATGAPTTLSGTPVISAYVGNSTTQLTAGITLTVDFDGVTGLHNVRVVATSGNGYATASNYQLVITTGTVGGTSAVGYVIAEFSIEARSAIMPTTAARTLDVTATGAAGIDLGNVENQGTTLGLTGTTVAAVTTTTTTTNLTNLPAITANWLTASGIAAGALDGKGNWNIGKTGYTLTVTTGLGNQTADITGSLSGSVGSVTGAVGSVTGAVGSVTAAVTVGTNNDKTGYGLSAAAVQAIWDALTTALTTAGSIGKKLADWVIGTTQTGDSFARLGAPAGVSVSADIAAIKAETASIQTDTNDLQTQIGTAGAGLTNITINAASVDLIWDEPTAGHATAGTTGKALTDAGSAGDPWSTALPGAYGAGTAGKIVGDNINAPIATVDTVVDAIKSKTDSLTFTVANQVDANAKSMNATTILGTGAAGDLWRG